jgi:hypothetical protein
MTDADFLRYAIGWNTVRNIERIVDWLEGVERDDGVDGRMTKAEVIENLNAAADTLAWRLREWTP